MEAWKTFIRPWVTKKKCENKNLSYQYVIITSRTRFRVTIHSISLAEFQGTPYSKQARYPKFNWQQRDSNHNHLVRKHTLNHLTKLASFPLLSQKLKLIFNIAFWNLLSGKR